MLQTFGTLLTLKTREELRESVEAEMRAFLIDKVTACVDRLA